MVTVAVALSLYPHALNLSDATDVEPYCPPHYTASAASEQPVIDSMHIRSSRDVGLYRQRLANLIWNLPELPHDTWPDLVESGIEDTAFMDLPRDVVIDRMTMHLPHGFVAYAYYFKLVPGERGIAIYQHGHNGSFRGQEGREVIEGLIDGGLSVIAFDMPMRGVNSWPDWVDVPNIGPVDFRKDTHWMLAILERPGFSPLRLFFDPLLRAINHATRERDDSEIVMVGLSGGGWMTTIYAALDERVRKSYPVAGTLPFALHGSLYGESSIGDYEQRHPGLFSLASYLDLYVLGAAGGGRRQVQILNEFDPCCFPGVRGMIYAGPVRDRVEELGLGGSWQLLVDSDSTSHDVSRRVLDFILKDSETGTDACPIGVALSES